MALYPLSPVPTFPVPYASTQQEAEAVEASKGGVFAAGAAVDDRERREAATRERERKKKEVRA